MEQLKQRKPCGFEAGKKPELGKFEPLLSAVERPIPRIEPVGMLPYREAPLQNEKALVDQIESARKIAKLYRKQKSFAQKSIQKHDFDPDKSFLILSTGTFGSVFGLLGIGNPESLFADIAVVVALLGAAAYIFSKICQPIADTIYRYLVLRQSKDRDLLREVEERAERILNSNNLNSEVGKLLKLEVIK